MKSFQDLVVWQKGIRLCLLIYAMTKGFLREEIYGLTSQMRRAAVSIPANIAEGAGRLNTPEFKQFLGVTRASNFELMTHLVIAKELGYCESKQLAIAEGLCSEVGAMIFALITSISGRGKAKVPIGSSAVRQTAHALEFHTPHFTLRND